MSRTEKALLHGAGRSFPLGATVHPKGVNFSVFSKGSEAVQLLLFDAVDDRKPARVIELDRLTHRTYHYWHVFVPGISAGQRHAYRVSGPFDPDRGLCFDPEKVLLDITSHDGFTLNELVSYNEKHNEENSQENRDGSDDNLSWNCGV